MRALLHTEFDALLARAGVSQASFARLTGVTARQVNNWARGRAPVPQWAALLVVALRDFSSESLTIALDEAEFSWREILGLSPSADTPAVRRAMTRLTLRYHPDKGGRPEQMTRVNVAYETALREMSARYPIGPTMSVSKTEARKGDRRPATSTIPPLVLTKPRTRPKRSDTRSVGAGWKGLNFLHHKY